MSQCINHPDRRGVAVVCDECARRVCDERARKARGLVCRHHPDRVANHDRAHIMGPGVRVPMCQECLDELDGDWVTYDVRFIP
jgi:hypothetical protein